jgi:hypothetical protein
MMENGLTLIQKKYFLLCGNCFWMASTLRHPSDYPVIHLKKCPVCKSRVDTYPIPNLYWQSYQSAKKLSSTSNNIKKIKSPTLQAVIVEPILISCINGISICKLSMEIQRFIPLPYDALKSYLFFLINYNLLSYNGQSQVYITEDGGFDILNAINKEKRISKVNSKDIVITIEEYYH